MVGVGLGQWGEKGRLGGISVSKSRHEEHHAVLSTFQEAQECAPGSWQWVHSDKIDSTASSSWARPPAYSGGGGLRWGSPGETP